MCIAIWLWLTGISLTSSLGQENHGICLTLLFFPAFCSVFSIYLSSVLWGQAVSLLINQWKQHKYRRTSYTRRWNLSVVLICISLMAKNVEHFHKCLSPILDSSVVSSLFRSVLHFFIGLFVLSFKRSSCLWSWSSRLRSRPDPS